MSLGTEIDLIINTHIELWHRTSKARLEKDLSSEERVALFMRTRDLNVKRAEIRDKINQRLKSGYPDPKINYKE
jgi:hypothetical protein